MRLLVVEDEHRLADRLARGLREESFAVDIASTTTEARDLAVETDYDLVLLDLKLPDGSGLELLEEWRAEGVRDPGPGADREGSAQRQAEGAEGRRRRVPDQAVLVRGAAGADPGAPASIRRAPASVLEMGDLRLDRTGHRVERAGQSIELTAKEFALLEFLALHPGQVLSRATIAEHVWDSDYDGE